MIEIRRVRITDTCGNEWEVEIGGPTDKGGQQQWIATYTRDGSPLMLQIEFHAPDITEVELRKHLEMESWWQDRFSETK